MTTKPRRAAASPVSVKLDAEERTRLSALAAARKRSSHYLMREELRQDFADEAEKARADFEQTGLHVTHAEMDGWAKSLGTRRPERFPRWHK
jgi:predicted transcriptional regulator